METSNFFDSSEINESRLGVIVEMDHIQDIIYHKIHSLRSVKIFDNQKISDISEDDTGVTVKSEKDVFKSKLLIACDGKNSYIRNYLKIRNFCHSYEQVAAVFNISHELDHNNTAYEFFYPNGPLAFLPRKNSHESSVVWIEKKMDACKGEYFNNKLFLEELGKRLYPTHGSVKLISQINHYPLYLQFSKKYFSNKTIFIGDSLHHIHPVAGQGFNLSVKDIICLVNLIDDYKSYGFLINDRKLFEEFFKERVISNANMIGITHGLNLVFSNNNFVLKKFRNFGVGLINKSGYLKNILMNYAMGRK